VEKATLILLHLLLSFRNPKMASVELSSNRWLSCLHHKADLTFFTHTQDAFARGKPLFPVFPQQRAAPVLGGTFPHHNTLWWSPFI